jgi:hypothetical protein
MSKSVKWLVAILVAAGLFVVARAATQEIYYLPIVYRQPPPTATATLTPTLTPAISLTPTRTPTQTLLPGVEVLIVDVDFDPEDNPLDEWVDIENKGDKTADMGGWRLRSETIRDIYIFPDNFDLGPGDEVRVWTKSGSDDSDDLFMDRSEPVWNDNQDCAYLRDEDDEPVSSHCAPLTGIFNIP